MHTNPHALDAEAKVLNKTIGKHHKLIGRGGSDAEYQQARAESDAAVSLVKYLICHLSNRHLAVTFAYRCGMPGYINHR